MPAVAVCVQGKRTMIIFLDCEGMNSWERLVGNCCIYNSKLDARKWAALYCLQAMK